VNLNLGFASSPIQEGFDRRPCATVSIFVRHHICFFKSAVGDINIILFLFFSESMRQLWDPTKAVQKNLSDFGLAFDSNKVINAKSTKAAMVDRAKKSDGNPWKKIEEDKELKQVEK